MQTQVYDLMSTYWLQKTREKTLPDSSDEKQLSSTRRKFVT